VVIDAGHGGEDMGARGYGAAEKNVTLSIARQLADALNAIPGVKSMLTRDRDFFIPLHERYKIAEKAHADMFISIHCNSSRRRGHGSGTEVYFLSLKGASDQADKDLADIENAADLVGGVAPQAEDDMVNVLYEVRRSSMLERSQAARETLLDHMAADRRVDARGIKQAGFAVLKSVEFPSVLVETAFINNPQEVKLLKDAGFQQRMAQQLATGVKAYFAKGRGDAVARFRRLGRFRLALVLALAAARPLVGAVSGPSGGGCWREWGGVEVEAQAAVEETDRAVGVFFGDDKGQVHARRPLRDHLHGIATPPSSVKTWPASPTRRGAPSPTTATTASPRRTSTVPIDSSSATASPRRAVSSTVTEIETSLVVTRSTTT
jgi:N-acetylmuramoyl-L-alanine amidase